MKTVSLFGYLCSAETKASYERKLPAYNLSKGKYKFEYKDDHAIFENGVLVSTTNANIDWIQLLKNCGAIK